MDYYHISAQELGQGAKLPILKLGDSGEVFYEMALEMVSTIRANNAAGKHTVFICPVGPVGQYPIFVRLVNREKLSLKNCWFINMDEYLTDDGQWIDQNDPLSFRGFMARNSNDIVRVEHCPLLSHRLCALLQDGRDILSAARSAVFENRTAGGMAEVSAFEGDDDVSLGDRSVSISIGDISYLVSANVFFQSNPRLLPELLSFVHDNSIGNIIMDLYSGVGTFSAIFENSHAKVYAVEREKRCLALARKNAPSALSFTADVALWGKKNGVRPDTIIVDPPRTGIARDALSLIASFGAERIIYVSCNSATAARDIGMLPEYSVDKARVFDFYPGSGHEESAFVLTRH